MATALRQEDQEAIAGFVDVLLAEGFDEADVVARTARLHELWDLGGPVKQAVCLLRVLTMLVFYGLPTEEDGSNPNWGAIGYPGPLSAPPLTPQGEVIETWEPSEDSAELTVDVCVVGSGAGGGVIAGVLAQAGLAVAVLEMGGYFTEVDYDQRELPGYQRLWLNRGLVASTNGALNVLAGSNLGGGTTINFMVCLPPPDDLRAEWAKWGLDGIDGPDFGADIEAVSRRINVNTQGSVHNQTNQKLLNGSTALGLEVVPLPRNCSADDDPATCGYCGWGCQRGAKLSTAKTWLLDASRVGARIVTRCRAERILTEDGRAYGVEAVVTHADGTTSRLVVRAPNVVVAAGAVNSPALLLRSGLGGPAVGHNLRVHPIYAVNGLYDERIDGWSGQIISAANLAFSRVEPMHGFLIETIAVFPGFWSACLPWVDGRQHKELMQQLPHMAPFLAITRDHEGGVVRIDDQGRPLIEWSLDPADRLLAVRAHQEMARIHEAAGARSIVTLHQQPVEWHRGEAPLDDSLARLAEAPYGDNDLVVQSAHQQGSCRLGTDPTTSVADPNGQLHDTPGVWIGDGSAFPSAVGVNPMLTIMALAHRTARRILATL
jgi:choline dehydrogenase-like flavoprotein